MPPILELHQISKSFGGQTASPLFSNVSAVIDSPELVAVLGPSGQGKSTLLRVLALLEAADAGKLSLHGKRYGDWQSRDWRKRVCYVAQQPVMLPGTVSDNLQTVSRLHGCEFDRSLAESLMAQAGLGAMSWDKPAAECSGGEKQRLALVRSILLRPDVLLLDEVTSSLDIQSREGIGRLLAQWHRNEGCTLISVTHSMEEARSMYQRIWFMGEGTLLEDCSSAEFFDKPATDASRAFLNKAVI